MRKPVNNGPLVKKNPYYDQYTLAYSVYGFDLDVDLLLASEEPSSAYEIWRKGERRKVGKPPVTSGLRIEILETGDRAAVARAILEFLQAEEAFLKAAARATRREGYSVLSCPLWVYRRVPTGIWLEAPVLRKLGRLGIGWEVTGYPCSRLTGP